MVSPILLLASSSCLASLFAVVPPFHAAALLLALRERAIILVALIWTSIGILATVRTLSLILSDNHPILLASASLSSYFHYFCSLAVRGTQ